MRLFVSVNPTVQLHSAEERSFFFGGGGSICSLEYYVPWETGSKFQTTNLKKQTNTNFKRT